ncbi:hypothetical protein CERSUDRAFT_96238 [Gelatoporia subvermispora B]|uniref:Cytochrome P450 n=1 Tax=Ceriporiopsis subvermispora (strain B) TaxID=914234 RepID=M2PIP0_CERS8|nr:hypothetical protein CERSUDRAFT_96238 [Gelatoporia subvermispora B]
MKPVIGNIMHVGLPEAWVKFTAHKEKYGDLVYFRGLGKSVLVVNSLKAMTHLLEKRANNYSGRARLVFGHDLMGLDRTFVLRDYGDTWRAERKLAHMALSPSAVKTYDSILEEIAVRLAADVLEAPENFYAMLRLTTTRALLAVTYGVRPEHADGDIPLLAEELNRIGQKAVLPGSYLCDTLPFLKYAPSWMQFQKEAKYGWDVVTNILNVQFDHVKREMEAGTAPPSLVQQLLTDPPENMPNLEDRIKGAAGGMYGAGADTTLSAVLAFVLAMDRMPSINDIPNLPYVEAVINETMRWHPSVPLGVPHCSFEDDEYEGYFIPKGTVVIPNVWSIAFEPNDKYNPQEFIPERFLDHAQPALDPSVWAFGFGRRICSGRFLARNSIFIFATTLLWAFDLAPPSTGCLDVRFNEYLITFVSRIWIFCI